MSISSPSGSACSGSRGRPAPDGGQLGLRARRLRARRDRPHGLLAAPGPPRARAEGACGRPPTGRAGRAAPATTMRKTKFIAGGAVIAAALAYMIYAGVTQSAVYFVTPSEIQAAPIAGKSYRLGGLVTRG